MPERTVCVLLIGGPWHDRRHTVDINAYESTIFTDDPRVGYYYVDLKRPAADTGRDFSAQWISTPRHGRTAYGGSSGPSPRGS